MARKHVLGTSRDELCNLIFFSLRTIYLYHFSQNNTIAEDLKFYERKTLRLVSYGWRLTIDTKYKRWELPSEFLSPCLFYRKIIFSFCLWYLLHVTQSIKDRKVQENTTIRTCGYKNLQMDRKHVLRTLFFFTQKSLFVYYLLEKCKIVIFRKSVSFLILGTSRDELCNHS